MEKTIQLTAIEASSTVEQLRAFVNQSHELNRVIAKNVNADAEILREILNFRDGTDDDRNPELRRSILQHPNAGVGELTFLARENPVDLLKNPALRKIIAENDEFFLDVPELLSTPGCPEDLLAYAAKSGDQKSRVYLLLNPELPESLKTILSGDRSFEEAHQRLSQFIAESGDEIGNKYLQVYANTSAKFCIPRFCLLDKANPAHRLADQVLCGFPYTSSKWQWPIGSNGEYMQPIAQINLESAGLLLNEDLGVGLLQIWGGVGQGLGVHATRVIPVADFNDAPDDFYPEHAPWLKTDYSGDLEFDGCTVASFCRSDYLPFSPQQCRIEWVGMGSMFYPSVYLRVSNSLELDDPDGVIKGWDADWSDLESLDETLEDLKLPTALTHEVEPLFQLGGYGDGLGNTWSETNGSLLLWHSIDYAVKITVAVYFKRSSDGDLEFTVVSNCDN